MVAVIPASVTTDGPVGVASIGFFIDRDKVSVNGSGSSSSSSGGSGSDGIVTGDGNGSSSLAGNGDGDGDGGGDDSMSVVGTDVNDTRRGVLEWSWMRVLDALREHHGIRYLSTYLRIYLSIYLSLVLQ